MFTTPIWKNKPSTRTLVIFDRDNTLNIDSGYAHQIEQLNPTSLASNLVSTFENHEFDAAIASNQSGIGRGLYKTENFLEFTLELLSLFDQQQNHFFMICACPHLSNDNCNCRKPKNMMLKTIIRQGRFNKVLVVGDSLADQLAAKSLSLEFIDAKDSDAAQEIDKWLGA